MVCTPSTRTQGDDAWKRWGDDDGLRANGPARRSVFLSGDIPKNHHAVHRLHGHEVHAFTASGAARAPFKLLKLIKIPGAMGPFGVLDLDGAQVQARWFGQTLPAVTLSL